MCTPLAGPSSARAREWAITNRGHPPGDAKAVLQAGCPRTVALTSWGGVVPGTLSGAGAGGGCPPQRGPPAPAPGQLVRRQGTVICVRGRIHPGTGCGWRHRPQPGHTTHTPHTTKDQAHQVTRAARACPRRHARISSIIVRIRRHAGMPLLPSLQRASTGLLQPTRAALEVLCGKVGI